MTAMPILRPRAPGARGHRARRTIDPTRWAARPALAVAAGGPAPPLGFRSDEDDRRAWISGSLALLLHAGLLGAVFVAAWLAPATLQEERIEVTLLQPEPEPVELPGSNDPSGGPKALAARAPASAAAMAAAMAAAATAEAPRALDDLSTRDLQMAKVDAARAPVDVKRRELDVQRLDAPREPVQAPRALDVATLSPVAIDPGDLSAPKLDVRVPTAIESAAPVAVTAPQAFAGYRDANPQSYAGQAATVGDSAPAATSGGALAGRVGVDTVVGGALVAGTGGGGAGEGSGSGAPTVECLRSAYVHRYMKEVERRTYARWEEPPETAADSTVKLRFKLDVTGSPTAVEFVETDDEALGRSAVEALRSAAPFPPMDANVRCLAERNLTATFTANPSS